MENIGNIPVIIGDFGNMEVHTFQLVFRSLTVCWKEEGKKEIGRERFLSESVLKPSIESLTIHVENTFLVRFSSLFFPLESYSLPSSFHFRNGGKARGKTTLFPQREREIKEREEVERHSLSSFFCIPVASRDTTYIALSKEEG